MSAKSDIKIIGYSVYEMILRPYIIITHFALFSMNWVAAVLWVAIISSLLNYFIF